MHFIFVRCCMSKLSVKGDIKEMKRIDFYCYNFIKSSNELWAREYDVRKQFLFYQIRL